MLPDSLKNVLNGHQRRGSRQSDPPERVTPDPEITPLSVVNVLYPCGTEQVHFLHPDGDEEDRITAAKRDVKDLEDYR